MDRELCLMHANCQGEALAPLLDAHPGFRRRFRIRHLLNYARDPVTDELLSGCGLFLHQHLAPKWGDLASDAVLARLPASCRALPLPNFFFLGYWPRWTREAPIEFGDSLLEELLGRGLDGEQAMLLHARAGRTLLGDVEDVAEMSLRREEEKDARGVVRYAAFLRENWRRRQLFVTVNHPGRELLFLAADAILRELGFGPLPESARAAYVHPQENFWLPIHPALRDLLGLPFVSRERRYPAFGADITHGDFVRAYLACRALGVRELTDFLRQRAMTAGNITGAGISGGAGGS